MGSPGQAETPRAIQDPPHCHGLPSAGRCGAPHGTRSGSEPPSGQSTLFNPAEGNARPFYLLRKEEITTTFLLGSSPLSAPLLAPLPTLLLKWQPLCCRHRRAAGALKQHPVSCSHLLCAIVSARPNNSTIVITTLCTNTNELVNRGPTKIKPL